MAGSFKSIFPLARAFAPLKPPGSQPLPFQLHKNQKSGASPLSVQNRQPGYLSIGPLSRDGTRIDGVRALIGAVISGRSCLHPHSQGDEIEVTDVESRGRRE
jgi:hypothetical protein